MTNIYELCYFSCKIALISKFFLCFSLKTVSRGDTEDARLREGEFWKEINSEDIFI